MRLLYRVRGWRLGLAKSQALHRVHLSRNARWPQLRHRNCRLHADGCSGQGSRAISFAKEVADQMIFMDEGMIVEKADTKEFFANPKSERLSTTSYAQQPGNRGKFDATQLPKIGVLTGTLIDTDTKEPLPFAAVKITHTMSEELVTGGMTDDKGRFKIESITLGPNQVEFAYVGYKTETQEVRFGREGIEIDLGKIGLQSSGVELNEVTVEAEREFMTNEIDRKVYDPSKLILSKTGSATDILENIPAVELDVDGNITLRGSSANSGP